MQIKATVYLDDARKDQAEGIAEAISFAIQGALHTFRDGKSRHSQVIDFEVEMEIETE